MRKNPYATWARRLLEALRAMRLVELLDTAFDKVLVELAPMLHAHGERRARCRRAPPIGCANELGAMRGVDRMFGDRQRRADRAAPEQGSERRRCRRGRPGPGPDRRPAGHRRRAAHAPTRTSSSTRSPAYAPIGHGRSRVRADREARARPRRRRSQRIARALGVARATSASPG